ncbi:unnamed protein product [Phytomonas sp. Hart1]|nr:unnamed protein product [Phytomonas sp. Hart1]|eukprot:CCW71734.1 unnamed protein product [Phytomonas sp. isolate Hart1]
MWHSRVLRHISALDLCILEQRGSTLSYRYWESTDWMRESYQRTSAAQRFRCEERAASLCEEFERMEHLDHSFLDR